MWHDLVISRSETASPISLRHRSLKSESGARAAPLSEMRTATASRRLGKVGHRLSRSLGGFRQIHSKPLGNPRCQFFVHIPKVRHYPRPDRCGLDLTEFEDQSAKNMFLFNRSLTDMKLPGLKASDFLTDYMFAM